MYFISSIFCWVLLMPIHTSCSQQQTDKTKNWIIKSFHLLEVAYMKSSVQLPLGKKPKPYQSLMYGAKSYVIICVQAKECLKKANILEEWKCKNSGNDETSENAKTVYSHCLEIWAWTESTIPASMHLWLSLSFESLQAGKLEHSANIFCS